MQRGEKHILPKTGRRSTLRFGLLLLILTVPAGIISPVSAGDGSYRIELQRVEYWTGVEDFFVTDLDGDGDQELVRLFTDRRTFMANHFSRHRLLSPALFQGNAVHRITSITPLDIDSLPGTELAVAMRDITGDSLWVEIICGYDKETILSRTQAIIGKDITEKGSHANPGWDASASHCYAADLDDDGRPEIIVPLVVGFDLYPRGVYVYEYPSGRLRWWFPLAGNPSPLKIVDANGDGFREIYFKTGACANGAEVNGRSDTTAYAFCLDHLGNILWQQGLGDRFDFQTGNVLLCDCDHDDVTEIYYTVLLRQQEYDRQVRVLEKHRAINNEFMHQRSFDADHQYQQIHSADMNGDGVEKLIVDGFVGILNPGDLTTLGDAGFLRATVAVIEDIDGDGGGRPEIILVKSDSLYILDAKLNIIGAQKAENGGRFQTVRHFTNPSGEHFLGLRVTPGPGEIPCTFCIYRVTRAAGAAVPGGLVFDTWLYAGIFVLVGFVPGLVVGLVIKRKGRYRRILREHTSADYEHLLTSLVSFNHGRTAGKNLDRLQFLFSNLPDASDKLAEITPNIRSAIDAYQTYTLTQLELIAAKAGKPKRLRPAMTALMAAAEKLTAILREVSDLQLAPESANDIKRSVPQAIEGVKRAIDGIRTGVQSYFSANLLKVIPHVLSAVAGQLHQQGVRFSAITTTEGPGQLVFFSETELAAIFEELIANACDAMVDSDNKELSLVVNFRSGEVVVQLSDTGSGLGKDDPDRIFRRDYSTKSRNGGYGLYHARQQVERFGGSMRAFNNADGPGATIEFIVKAVGHD